MSRRTHRTCRRAPSRGCSVTTCAREAYFSYLISTNAKTTGRERAQRASHANGASRRSGERVSVRGSPRGEAPRMKDEDRSLSQIQAHERVFVPDIEQP